MDFMKVVAGDLFTNTEIHSQINTCKILKINFNKSIMIDNIESLNKQLAIKLQLK